MAPPVLCRSASRLLAPARLPSAPRARWKFYVREPLRDRPDWPKVGLTLGTAVALWIHILSDGGSKKVSMSRDIELTHRQLGMGMVTHSVRHLRLELIKKHNEDVLEYKRRNGLE